MIQQDDLDDLKQCIYTNAEERARFRQILVNCVMATDIFDKKGGALDFVVLEYTYTNQHGELVAKASSTLVQRNG